MDYIMLYDNKYIEMTVCDEDCIPYEEPDDKEDEEWNPLRERFERPRKMYYKRKLLYHCSVVASIIGVCGLIFWTYDILYKYSNVNNYY